MVRPECPEPGERLNSGSVAWDVSGVVIAVSILLARRTTVVGMGSSELDDLADRDRQARIDDERAASRDAAANQADRDADQRDERAHERDVAAHDHADEPNRERGRAADDRAHAAEDRSRASQDRQYSQSDRQRASEDRGAAHDAVGKLKGLLYRAEDDDEVMLLLGQAQGMIMTARDATPLQALLELSARAAKDGTELVTAAHAIVGEARPPPNRRP